VEQAASIHLLDFIVILVYFGLIILIGQYFSRYVTAAKDYFAAGNIMPWWLAGTSFYMASHSALLFVIYSEIAYLYGIIGVVINWIMPFCILIGGYFLAHRWRRARVLTPLGFMERRYNSTVHQVFVWTGFPLRIFDDALKIFSTAIVLAVAFRSLGMTIGWFMVIVGAIMIAYSFMGGQMTVMVTDFFQASIKFTGVILLFILTFAAVGNLGQFFQKLPQGFLNPVREPYGWSYLIFTVFLITLLNYNASWALVQKYNTVRSEKDAHKMIYLIAALLFFSPPIFFFPALAAKVILPPLSNSKEVYAAISLKILPIGMMGLILSALLSATLAVLGSEFNTLSGVLTRDFYKKKINSNISEKKEIFLGRAFTVLIGITIILIALLLNVLKGLNLMDIMFRFFSAFGPAIMIPLIFGLLFKKFNSRGAIWGVIAGSATGVFLVCLNFILIQIYAKEMASSARLDFWLRSGWNSAATVLNIASTVFGLWLGTAAKKTSEEERNRVEAFFKNLGTPFVLEEKGSRVFSFFKIIGFALAAFGLAIVAISLIALFIYHDRRAFSVDLAVGGFLLIFGLIVWILSRRKK
jgi:SSS family solute:Na+ symporter